jgi:hypothetical protein
MISAAQPAGFTGGSEDRATTRHDDTAFDPDTPTEAWQRTWRAARYTTQIRLLWLADADGTVELFAHATTRVTAIEIPRS